MIADLAELERLGGRLAALASELDDASNGLRMTVEELREEPGLCALGQHRQLTEAVGHALERMMRANTLLEELKRLLLSVPQEYERQERAMSRMLERMTAGLSSVGAAVGCAVSGAQTEGVAASEEAERCNRLMRLLAEQTDAVLPVNVAAVTGGVAEVLDVERVADLPEGAREI